MKIINFTEQNGAEWLAWRRCGIGASDISVIMRSNPYKTPLQLWENKCGFRPEDAMNRAMAHGVQNEDVARQWLNENNQMRFTPICVEDPELGYLRASLDGWDVDSETLVEIKCPVSERVLDAARMKQSIPDYWFDQIQWQIMLTNPKRAFIALWDYRHGDCITIDMFGHKDKILKMREKAKAFWHNVMIGKAPEPEKNDYVEIDDPKLHERLLEYQNLSNQVLTINERKKELKSQIEDFGDDGSFSCHGFKIQRVAPRTSYDVEQMKMDGIDIEKYVKKSNSIGFYKISSPKK